MAKKPLLAPLREVDKRDPKKVEAHDKKLREHTDRILAAAGERAKADFLRRLERMVSDGQLTEAEAAKHRAAA